MSKLFRCLIGYPTFLGHVILSAQDQDLAEWEDITQYRKLGFIVMVDPDDEYMLNQLTREERWRMRGWL